MAKLKVTPVSRRAQFKVGKKTYRFSDVFEADDKDKRILAAIKCRVLKKVHDAKVPDKVEPAKSATSKTADK